MLQSVKLFKIFESHRSAIVAFFVCNLRAFLYNNNRCCKWIFFMVKVSVLLSGLMGDFIATLCIPRIAG